MKQPRFSVIVPAHNAAKFIRKGLDSIRHQTFENYELIIICDACEDNTVEIAREYSDIVIEVNNKRLGPTWNTGLDIAQGEWILFMDDDDWFLHEYVFQLIDSEVGKENEDVLLLSFIWKNEGYTTQSVDHYWNAVWCKVWRREFVGDTRADETISVAVDKSFTDRVMSKHPALRAKDIPIYYYNYMRKGSITWLDKRGRI